MRVLLTGARGMVGRSLRQSAEASASEAKAGANEAKAGAKVEAELVLLCPPRSELDLRDYAAVCRYLEREQPDLIVHAAAKVGGIAANVADPVGFLVENLETGINLVRAAHATGVSRLLNIASSCIYPKDSTDALTEGHLLRGPLEPTNEGYALGKIAVLKLCEYMQQQFGRAYKTVIPCNLYGPWDHFEPGSSHLLAAAILKLHVAKVRGARAVEIWGDGSARREFLYVGDFSEFLNHALSRFDSLPNLLNVGVGQDHSIRDYYETAAAVVGYTGTFTYARDKPTGMRRKLLDCSLATQWGWQAQTPLPEGIAATYRFLRENVPWEQYTTL
jgi:GDP-L-fucose synthase